ncbi:MAG: GPW/gp25 family protein [Marmoricola sp.]
MTNPSIDTRTPELPPRIRLPYGPDDRGRTATCTEEEHLRDLIEQVLLTSPGERVMRPTFGGALLQRVFEPGGPELLATTQYVVEAAIAQYLADRITVSSLALESRDNQLVVTVSWTLLRTSEEHTMAVALPAGSAS